MAYRHPEQYQNVRIRKDLYKRVKEMAKREGRSAVQQLQVMVEAQLKGK